MVFFDIEDERKHNLHEYLFENGVKILPYEGVFRFVTHYDLDKNGFGDVPYHPLSLFAVLAESNPSTMLLYRSFMISLLDKSEKVLPSITPDNFIDNKPLMKSLPI